MNKYFFTFTSGDPRPNTGLAPTFLLFFNAEGATQSPPGITEIFPSSGVYQFQYNTGYSSSIFYLIDGATTGLGSSRYLNGQIQANDALSLQLGWTGSSIGSTSVDPTGVMGYAMRTRELLEGNQTFLNSTNTLSMYSRGASTLLATKVVTQSTTGITKV